MNKMEQAIINNPDNLISPLLDSYISKTVVKQIIDQKKADK